MRAAAGGGHVSEDRGREGAGLVGAGGYLSHAVAPRRMAAVLARAAARWHRSQQKIRRWRA